MPLFILNHTIHIFIIFCYSFRNFSPNSKWLLFAAWHQTKWTNCGYFGQFWPNTPKMLVSTGKKLSCLSACKKKLYQYFFLKILQKYYSSISFSSLDFFYKHCKDIGNLLFWKLWECLTIPIKIIVSICRKL